MGPAVWAGVCGSEQSWVLRKGGDARGLQASTRGCSDGGGGVILGRTQDSQGRAAHSECVRNSSVRASVYPAPGRVHGQLTGFLSGSDRWCHKMRVGSHPPLPAPPHRSSDRQRGALGQTGGFCLGPGPSEARGAWRRLGSPGPPRGASVYPWPPLMQQAGSGYVRAAAGAALGAGQREGGVEKGPVTLRAFWPHWHSEWGCGAPRTRQVGYAGGEGQAPSNPQNFPEQSTAEGPRGSLHP